MARQAMYISIHALLAESDAAYGYIWPAYLHFYPRSPCGERRCYLDNIEITQAISIHALLAESDNGQNLVPSSQKSFLSTLSLRRATSIAGLITSKGTKFLSTLSLRRATPVSELRVTSNVHFYPRSPCGERHYFSGVMRQNPGISIHALLAESDLEEMTMNIDVTDFYPRSPCGERRHQQGYYQDCC